jgi:hypothetical protein
LLKARKLDPATAKATAFSATVKLDKTRTKARLTLKVKIGSPKRGTLMVHAAGGVSVN